MPASMGSRRKHRVCLGRGTTGSLPIITHTVMRVKFVYQAIAAHTGYDVGTRCALVVALATQQDCETLGTAVRLVLSI